MFTIDLLKGRGIPIKRKPWGAAIAAMAFAVPFFAAMTMFGIYLSNRIVVKVARQEIANYESNIAALSESVKMQKTFETKRSNLNECLKEARASLGKHTQWTPILATVVESLPESMILTKLDAKPSSMSKRVPTKDDPNKMAEVTIPANALQMNIIGMANSDSDKAVKDFKDHLRLSTLLGSKMGDIRISQKADVYDGQSVISYDLDCVFEP